MKQRNKWRDREEGGWERDVEGGVLIIETNVDAHGQFMGRVIEPDHIPSDQTLYPFQAYFGKDEMSEASMKREMTLMCNEYIRNNRPIYKDKDGVFRYGKRKQNEAA